jgi:hypothetical protein
MCRSIKTLRGQEPTDEEVQAAALQFVRKISGYRAPSRANESAFAAAVEEIAESSFRLLAALPGSGRKEPNLEVKSVVKSVPRRADTSASDHRDAGRGRGVR